MTDLDRTTARALVEAGYMPLLQYVALFGECDLSSGADDVSIVPADKEKRFPLVESALRH
jgi:hypothetical protein